MEKAPIQSGIYAITHNGKTAHYATETFGNPQDVLMLLHRVHQAGVDYPDSPLSDVDRLLQYSHSMVPICINEHMRRFQPLEREEFEFVLGELEGGGGGTACYELDYDHDRFAVTSWDGNELKTASASLRNMIDVCGEALRRSGSSKTQTHLNAEILASSLAEIMTVEPAIITPSEPDHQGQEDLPGSADFIEPSM